MPLFLAFFILVSVLLSAGSQVLLKYGMTGPAVTRCRRQWKRAHQHRLTVASSPLVLTGLACFGLSAIVWLFVLSKIPLSTAYPFVALGIVITVLAGRLLFAEPISLLKLAGVLFIVAGVTMVAASS